MSFKIQIQSYNVCFYWYAQYFVRGWIHKICAQWFEASCSQNLVLLSPFMTYLRICGKCNTTCASCGTGSAYLSGAHTFTPVVCGVIVALSLVFCVIFCSSLFVFLSFYFGRCIVCLLFWPLYCLFYFGRCLICLFCPFILAVVLSVFFLLSFWPLYCLSFAQCFCNPRGRPRNTWRRESIAEMEIEGYRWQDLERMAQNRTRWRTIVSGLCTSKLQQA